MAYIALKDFLQYKRGEEVPDAEEHQNWIDEKLCAQEGEVLVKAPTLKKEEPKIDLDVNNDGKVDNEDVSIMAKTVGKRGGRPKKK